MHSDKSIIYYKCLIWTGIMIFIAILVAGVTIMLVNGQTMLLSSVPGVGLCIMIILAIFVYCHEIYEDANPVAPQDIV